MLKNTLIPLFIFLLFVSLAFQRNIMPIWQWVFPISSYMLLLLLLINRVSKIVVFVALIVFGFLILLFIEPFQSEARLTIKGKNQTYVVYNNCFLYCSPTVYQKIPYMPFAKFHRKIKSEQPLLRSFHSEKDTIYLNNGVSKRKYKLSDHARK